MMASFGVQGSLAADSNWNGTNADYRFVTPGYFEAMRTGIVAGRGFEDRDNEGIRAVGIVDETLARAVWPDDSPIGKRLEIGLGTQLNRDDQDGEDVLGNNAVEIIGVVQHARGIDVRREVRPQIYLPYRLGPSPNNVLAIRAAGDPAAVVELVRREVEELGTGRPIHSVRMMDAYVADAMGETRFTLVLMGSLAAIALLLSTVGVYSVIAYLVRNQTHETGIRMALGAHPADIVRLTVRQGFLLAAIGVPIGLAGAALLTRFIAGLLYGVTPTDPLTYAGIPLLLVLVALAASYVPARRASRVDPLVALRSDS
jgi:predicted permease